MVQASTEVRQDPDDVKIPYEINGVMYMLKPAQIQAYMDREEILKQTAEEERISKGELIKAVHEEGEVIMFFKAEKVVSCSKRLRKKNTWH